MWSQRLSQLGVERQEFLQVIQRGFGYVDLAIRRDAPTSFVYRAELFLALRGTADPALQDVGNVLGGKHLIGGPHALCDHVRNTSCREYTAGGSCCTPTDHDCSFMSADGPEEQLVPPIWHVLHKAPPCAFHRESSGLHNLQLEPKWLRMLVVNQPACISIGCWCTQWLR